MFLFTFGVFAKEKTKCQIKGDKLCCIESTKTSPFYLSVGQGEKAYSNFKSLNSKIEEKYLPKDTVIHIPNQIYKTETSEDFRYPFEVLTIPNSKLEHTSSKSMRRDLKDLYKGIDGKERVKKGDVGYVDKKMVKRIDGITFFISKNSPAYKTPRGRFINDYKIKLWEKDNGFGVKRCCPKSIPLKERDKASANCHNEYIFNLLNDSGKVVDYITSEEVSCHLYSFLTPIPDDDVIPLERLNKLLLESAKTSKTFKKAGVENFEIYKSKENDFSLMKFPLDPMTLRGPHNTHHYKQDDIVNSDAFIRPMTACTFLKVAEKFQKNCNGPGCEIQFGNIYHKKSWKPHMTHDTGECIDIRPFRRSHDDINVSGSFKGKNYDREKTKLFLELAIKMGGTSAYFNDMNLVEYFKKPEVRKDLMPYRKGDVWSFWQRIEAKNKSGHDDHIHVCFKTENPVVKQSCTQNF